MKPIEFYNLAHELADEATTEARRRSVVGRLYYGLHHEACCRLFREYPFMQPLRRNGRHSDLCNRYERLGTDVASDIARFLRLLMIMRAEADYQLSPPLRIGGRRYDTEAMMREAMNVAQDLLAALEAFSPGEAPDGCECRVAYVSG